MVTTKINVIPEVDQRFNLTRWSKLEKDSDFPLCFTRRKAEFFFFLPLLEKQRSGHPQRMSRCGHLKHACLYYKPV